MDLKSCYAFSALGFATLSALSFSLNAVFVRQDKYLNPNEIATYAFLGTFTFSLPWSVYHTPQIFGPRESRLLLLGRALFNGFENLLALACYNFLPVAKSAVLVNSVPAFISIFARILLKEPIGRAQILTAMIAVIGITLSVDPRRLITSHDADIYDSYVGVACGLASVFLCCTMMVLTRSLKKVHHTVQNTTSSLVGTTMALAWTLISKAHTKPQCGYRRFTAIGIGVTFFLGQMFLIVAFQMDRVGPVAIFLCSLEIVLGVFWQATLFGETIDVFCFSGTSLILMAVLLVGIRNWLLSREEEDPLRKRLRFFID